MKVKLNNTSSDLILCEAAAFRYKNRATVDNLDYNVSLRSLPQLPKVLFSEYVVRLRLTLKKQQLKTLILLLGEIFRQVEGTNFSFSEKNFARGKVSPNKFSPVKVLPCLV